MIQNDTGSLEVIHKLIIAHDLHGCEFYLVNHPAEINWRQKNADVVSKVANIASGIQFNNHDLIPIPGRELLHSGTLHKLTTPDNPLLSIASKVKATNDRIYHLPMMNIHLDIPMGVHALNKVLLTLVSDEYSLVRTDRYFHIYGGGLMTEDEWIKWNLKFLMADFLVSPRYIGHSLENGFNLLRINATESIKTTMPRLILQTEPDESLKHQEVKIFAVIKHASQLTEAGAPYFRHLYEVEKYTVDIALEMGLPESDIALMRQAALLHDCIEDTNTDYEDIEQLTGTQVADIVALLSNDKRKPRDERERGFLEQIKTAPMQVQIIKLADIYANLSSIEKEFSAGKKINVNYLTKAGLFLSVLQKQLENSTAFKNCGALTKRMKVSNDH